MNQQNEIIDLNFGLSQLSGNRALLIKLLGKFKIEYTELLDKLSEFQQQQDLEAYKHTIHTVKGVAGNLGLNALHSAAKPLESQVNSGSDFSAEFAEFSAILQQTLIQIAELEDEHEKPQTPSDDSGIQQLINILNKNEFVPPEQLKQLLDGSNLSAQAKQQITEAVGDLDYPLALQLLESA
ncbi:Hpt domain-containing protein [Aliiglaciecola sp. LCG003]|uniref:Hpt domain-containing protein n=1 Tax=Aliiglaciecola sp. LCG003 TaxID=3053655 RepID=UPI0025745187|nr:Hpt domain-containing protein [Aliiglaciecola sp. LCG003]WJG08318.1 Hpt domain-containing protein [Aliiglaciecola sp. LCG003]